MYWHWAIDMKLVPGMGSKRKQKPGNENHAGGGGGGGARTLLTQSDSLFIPSHTKSKLKFKFFAVGSKCLSLLFAS